MNKSKRILSVRLKQHHFPHFLTLQVESGASPSLCVFSSGGRSTPPPSGVKSASTGVEEALVLLLHSPRFNAETVAGARTLYKSVLIIQRIPSMNGPESLVPVLPKENLFSPFNVLFELPNDTFKTQLALLGGIFFFRSPNPVLLKSVPMLSSMSIVISIGFVQISNTSSPAC